MTSNRPIRIEDTESSRRPLEHDYKTSFKSKVAYDTKQSLSTEIRSPQREYQLHQVFPENTWLIDLVRFTDDCWYVFFVEANTRYLIPVEGNGEAITEDAWEPFTARVPSEYFMKAFKTFLQVNVLPKTERNIRNNMQPKNVSLIIGDSEKAFWTPMMTRFYKRLHIKTEKVNTAKEGHTRMSILDRLVRTIRDMFYTLNYKTYHPNDMIRIATIYNNTKHSTLQYTPKQVHENAQLERSIMRKLKAENWIISHRHGFSLNDGVEVSVRKLYKPFEKKRSTVERGTYTIQSKNRDGSYTVKNPEGKTLTKYRRDLKPIRK